MNFEGTKVHKNAGISNYFSKMLQKNEFNVEKICINVEIGP
jgi:hypothetical protein